MSLPTVEYNGTAPDGGDSREHSTRNVLQFSDDQPQPLVHHWRRSMDIDFDCPSLAYDSWGWILLLGSCPKKVSAFAHMAFSDVNSDCIVPGITLSRPSVLILLVVSLGIFTCFFQDCKQIYW